MATYDGSSLTGWTNSGGTTIDGTVGNPGSSFKTTGGNQSFYRDLGQNLKDKTIEFDVNITSGVAGFSIGGVGNLGLKIAAGTNSINGIVDQTSWLYPNNSNNTYTFTPGTWYSIKIITDNGSVGGTSWYVNGVLVGNSGGYSIGNGTYFGILTDGATVYYDNIKISGASNASDAAPTFRMLVAADFPTLNQNTTGNAATATLAANASFAVNITATSNTSLTSLSNLNTVGTITAGTWSGTAIAIANGGTGATTAPTALTNLGAAPINATINSPTGSYTLTSSDNGKVIVLSNSSLVDAAAITLTVPTGLAAGFNCMIVQKGAGIVTIVAAGGATVTNRSGFTKTGGQNAIVTILSIASNYFITGGDMQ